VTVSLEAIPRNREALITSAQAAVEFSCIGIINVPDLLRFSLRSWEACGILAEYREAGARTGEVSESPVKEKPGPAYMPHLRAIDFDPDRPFPYTVFFRSRKIDRVLVIAGDPPKDEIHKTYPVDTVFFIKKLKAEMPELRIYGAFDPYRTNIRYELDYLRTKEEAGVEGFFSQPFFDLRLLEIYAEYLEGKTVFWGVSPVLSASNRNYWESRNRAIFPKSFRPDFAWNIDFGRRVLDFCEACNFHLYLMPIKVDIKAYLSGIFETFRE
jgi:methylenetetrahydrofolate reductase (NADPH)